MTDIVKRLRAIAADAPGWPERGVVLEAADEIERLRAEIKEIRAAADAEVKRRALENKP